MWMEEVCNGEGEEKEGKEKEGKENEGKENEGEEGEDDEEVGMVVLDRARVERFVRGGPLRKHRELWAIVDLTSHLEQWADLPPARV